MRCRVKICGITNLDDALMACRHGADALGFVFYAKSPRYITPERANAIVSQLPPFVTPVALFVDADASLVDAVINGSARWSIQFHGNESESECLSYQRPYMKALRIQQGDNVAALVDQYPSASAMLLDAYKAGVPGGTGEVFDWSVIPALLSKPIVLAGGLTPYNVQQAVQQVRPYAVDVSGGVELSKGIKSELKVREFISGAKCE
ncbi:phosphoribosylanthranilate isomerase [Marinomonas sp. M1K-6]|uniref:N-(5'-phosphoribosyl)anthranilate isomerase n=1 Tax=Marinomonas profundi TaxID=2726122 RepID=A0A847R4K4_9GAMM|nr:phosphoribosylanthranilate isomerase [Marinomonas profundi]NLQ18922.1 phosphoribosylanthranilate isomerase [Marinomonas profundi]UDV02859.1 phosphoribosylanthranilate isomerase [Marinomonas profundi]